MALDTFMMLWLLCHVVSRKCRAATWRLQLHVLSQVPSKFAELYLMSSLLLFGFALGKEEEVFIATEDGLPLTLGVRGVAYTGMVIILPSLSLRFL